MKKLIIVLLIAAYSVGNCQQPDKVLHFVAGAAIADATFIAAYKITEDRNKSALIAFGTSIFAGLAKEVYDQISYGGFDEKDWASTAMGGAAVSISFQFVFDEKFKIQLKNKGYSPMILSELKLKNNTEIPQYNDLVINSSGKTELPDIVVVNEGLR